MIDLRRKAARRREDTVGLQHPEGKTVLQNILTNHNEVNCANMSWDVDGNSFLQNRASPDISKVEMNSISNANRPTSCEAETARDTHLREASSLATATIRKGLRYTKTRRTLWKLTGRSWTSSSRCRQKLNPQIQEGTPRVETTRVSNAEAQVEYLLQIADEHEAAVRNHHARQ